MKLAGQRIVRAIESAGGSALAIQADAADRNAAQAAVDKTVSGFGKLDAGRTGHAEGVVWRRERALPTSDFASGRESGRESPSLNIMLVTPSGR